ncbi:hypothetical protein NY547_09110 [Cnuibacter physcomitrellae]|uniref:DNA topoisomerase IB n=1 Tax=Cnuibacter physcomitrellae TaxID=1619308 RepID=UPI0021760866|nr:hypothetical protein [Cnuibacter physcomitrellae]MCS5497393.1 hypothetical protein [Cnuibacter physcomitrellae]
MSTRSPSAARWCRSSGLHRVDMRWFDDLGRPVQDDAILHRLRSLAIPPGWHDVWADTDPEARVQATGVDARGRTQYRYSAAAAAEATARKFADLLQFGGSLPTLRTHVERHLTEGVGEDSPSRVRRATAATVRLLDRGLFRVGSPRYARDNHTYGLTTLTREHVRLDGDEIEFEFIGKEHRPWHVTVRDGQVAEVIRMLVASSSSATAPLFSVRTPEGEHAITSAVVNAYVHGATSAPATAKTFRTWGGTAAAAAVAGGATAPFAARSTRPDLVAVEVAAYLLGNTRDVARRSYVHPLAFEAGRSPAVVEAIDAAARASGSSDVRELLRADAVVLALAAELARITASPPESPASPASPAPPR